MNIFFVFKKLSLRTVGKLGSFVYYWRPRNTKKEYVKRAYFVPVQPGTPAQTHRWDVFRAGVQSWQSLTPAQKKIYNDKVKYLKLHMEGFNLFMREYLLTH